MTTRHGKKGRLVLDFAGFHPSDEEELYKYIKKQLRDLVRTFPGKVTNSLRKVVDPHFAPPTSAVLALNVSQ